MKKSIALKIAMLVFVVAAYQARAAQVGLADWCVNVNSNITSACNGAGAGGGGIDLSKFDQTLEPSINGLSTSPQTVTVTLAAGVGQYVAFYADYDVDFKSFGAFDDSASTAGALAAGESWEASDPNTSNIFSDFSANISTTPLPKTNGVGTPSGPPSNCCDVAFALAFGNLTVPAGGGTVTFSITDSAPASGFYVEQTNQDTKDSIFLSGVFTPSGVVPPPPPGVPEPSTFGLGLSLMGVALAFRRRRAAQ